MPRAQNALTSRATKNRPTRNVKPYDRSSPVSGSDDLQETQGDGGSESDVDVKTVKPTKAKTKAKSEYDKLHLVSLIVKVSQLLSYYIINFQLPNQFQAQDQTWRTVIRAELG